MNNSTWIPRVELKLLDNTMKKLFTTTAQLDAAIVAVKKTGQKWQDDVQHIALSIIAHIEQHGDVTVAMRLMDALPKGARKNAMLNYMDTFSKATWFEPEGKDAPHFVYDKTKTTNMDGAAATTWADFTPPPAYKPMDLNKLLSSIVKRAEKDQKTTYNPAVIEGIKALITPEAETTPKLVTAV